MVGEKVGSSYQMESNLIRKKLQPIYWLKSILELWILEINKRKIMLKQTLKMNNLIFSRIYVTLYLPSYSRVCFSEDVP